MTNCNNSLCFILKHLTKKCQQNNKEDETCTFRTFFSTNQVEAISYKKRLVQTISELIIPKKLVTINQKMERVLFGIILNFPSKGFFG